MAGSCLEDSQSGEYFCEISAWCPVENDEKLSSKTPLLKNTEKFTVYIKNSVAFPYFGTDYRKNNILSEYQSDYMTLPQYSNTLYYTPLGTLSQPQ